jgi:hypothetical protein
MRKIIADSYAAIQPDDKLMAKWISEIKKLETGDQITEEDYYFMRSSDEVWRALMEITKGNDKAITSGTVPQILERAKELVRQESETKYQSEVEERKAKEAEISYIRAEQMRIHKERENKVHQRSQIFAKIVVRLLRIVSILLLILGVFLTLPLEFITTQEFISNIMYHFPSFILPTVFLVMLLISVLGQYYGTTINSWLNTLEIMIDKKVYKLLWSLSN